MTSSLDLLGFAVRVEHHPDPAAKDSPTQRFYVGLLQNGVEVVGRRKSIILVIGRNDIRLTWRNMSACRPTHAALYEHPTGGSPFDGNPPGPSVSPIKVPASVREGDMVTLKWEITWTG